MFLKKLTKDTRREGENMKYLFPFIKSNQFRTAKSLFQGLST
jgi:hypothetical protein